MISESHVWKDELKKELVNFKKFISSTKIGVIPPESNSFFFKVEKFFFVTAYIIRKLNEANKLSDELISTNIPVILYPRKNKHKILDFLNKHHTEKFFNYNKWQNSNLSCVYLYNCLIHSFIFDPVFNSKNWKVIGIRVTSDKIKDKALYYLEINNYFKFLEDVISDDVVKVQYNRATGKFNKSKNIL